MVYFYSQKHLLFVLCSLIHSSALSPSDMPSPEPGARNSASKQNTPAHQPTPSRGLPGRVELNLGGRSGHLSRLGVRDFPAGCDLGSASCAHSGLSVRWPRPSRASPLGLVGECPAACSRCACVCVCVRTPAAAGPPLPSPPVCGGERRASAGLEPSPSLSVFLPHRSVDPPHYFCSCSVAVFNSSSWRLSVLPKRYLVSVCHPSPSSSCSCIPRPPPPPPTAGPTL